MPPRPIACQNAPAHLGAVLCLALCLPGLVACSAVPEVAARETVAVQNGPWPQLAPLPELLADVDAPSRARPAEAEVGGRAAGLRARAAALRRTPVPGV